MRLVYWICCLANLASATPCFSADAEKPASNASGGILMTQVAWGAVHYRSSPEHKGHSWLVGAEWQSPSHWLGGYSHFNNSYDQKSHYLYGGYWWRIGERDPNWYAKLTGGVIHGYKNPYEDKIPFNHSGVAPAIVPALGYKMNRFNAQVNFFGTAGFMVTLGYDWVR
jgi:hypothetical protein